MAETFAGSVEVIRGDESIGVPGVAWNPAIVPTVLEALHGITGMESEEPADRPAGRTPEYQWSGKDASNQDVTIVLWVETPFDETVIGQAIAAELAKGS